MLIGIVASTPKKMPERDDYPVVVAPGEQSGPDHPDEEPDERRGVAAHRPRCTPRSRLVSHPTVTTNGQRAR